MAAGSVSPPGRAGRALRALASPALPTPPDPADLISAGSRRPGELHEALPVTAPEAATLGREAARTGVQRDVLASVTLELALISEDLGGLPDDLTAPALRMNDRALSAAEADYLRALTISRRLRPSAGAPAFATVSVPVRLTARLRYGALGGALDAEQVDAALAWETAAVIEGRTLSECVMLHASRWAAQSSVCSPGAASRPASRPSKTA
jgi:hypothetical protein